MSNFSVFTEESPNIIVAGKRPRSTVTPVILLRDGKPVAAAGIPGAARIPTAMIQTLLDVLHFGRSWEEAIADTRWHLATSGGSDEPSKLVHIEAGADESLVAGLRERGWTGIDVATEIGRAQRELGAGRDIGRELACLGEQDLHWVDGRELVGEQRDQGEQQVDQHAREGERIL
jgi:gamma-glutamyltranspeptidase